jgi:ankyrin repeat protein
MRFIEACSLGNIIDIKRMIEEENLNPMASTIQRQNPLHIACENGHIQVVKYLIENGYVDVNYTTLYKGRTPLHYACMQGHLDVVKYLFENEETYVNYSDSDGYKPFNLACKNCHMDVINFMIKHKRLDLSAKDKNGENPFHWACRHGHLHYVRFLIEHRHVDVNDTVIYYKNKAIHLACRFGHLDIIQYLIENKYVMDLNDRNTFQETILHQACKNNNLDVVKYLVEILHCDINTTDRNGCTPIFKACENGHLDIVRYLFYKNANIQIIDNYECNVLFYARDDKEIINFLLEECLLDANNIDFFYEDVLEDLLHQPLGVFKKKLEMERFLMLFPKNK